MKCGRPQEEETLNCEWEEVGKGGRGGGGERRKRRRETCYCICVAWVTSHVLLGLRIHWFSTKLRVFFH